MNKETAIKLFEEKQVRSVWDTKLFVMLAFCASRTLNKKDL
jgi:hypothetical protein